MGITKDNWPATVGLFSGIFAKEAIVGTLDTLYSRLDLPDSVKNAKTETFDFWDGIVDAFTVIPAAFKPAKDEVIDAETAATAKQTFSSISKFFDGQIGALAYLVFILIYSPCLAAITAIYKETNIKWATFSVLYLTGLAWIAATIVYQAGTFLKHPGSSAGWLSGCIVALAIFYGGLVLKTKNLTPKT